MDLACALGRLELRDPSSRVLDAKYRAKDLNQAVRDESTAGDRRRVVDLQSAFRCLLLVEFKGRQRLAGEGHEAVETRVHAFLDDEIRRLCRRLRELGKPSAWQQRSRLGRS